MHVAAGDVDGDGRADIITGAGAGGGPHVRVIRASDGRQLASFFAYAAQFTGGVRVGTTDFNGDQRAELVLSPGLGAPLQVRITDLNGQNQSSAFSPFASNPAAGAFVAAPRGTLAAVVLASPGPSPVHDAVLSTWNNSPTDPIADDLLNATVPSPSGSSRPAQVRRCAARLRCSVERSLLPRE